MWEKAWAGVESICFVNLARSKLRGNLWLRIS